MCVKLFVTKSLKYMWILEAELRDIIGNIEKQLKYLGNIKNLWSLRNKVNNLRNS